MNIRNATRDDTFHIIELAYYNAIETPIDGYKVDHTVWIAHIMKWLLQSEIEDTLFKVALVDDKIVGFLIGVPTSWHYSDDVYLELKEVIVDESLPKITKAKLVLRFGKIAEEIAQEAGLKGVSAFSIRDNSESYSNFFCKKLGWTKAAGAKKVFK